MKIQHIFAFALFYCLFGCLSVQAQDKRVRAESVRLSPDNGKNIKMRPRRVTDRRKSVRSDGSKGIRVLAGDSVRGQKWFGTGRVQNSRKKKVRRAPRF